MFTLRIARQLALTAVGRGAGSARFLRARSVGTPCDFDDTGVGINDFLELLANWGPCP